MIREKILPLREREYIFCAGRGEYPLQDNSCYALELCAVHKIPEWNNQRVLNLEETIIFSRGKAHFSSGARTGFHLVGRS